MATVNNLSKTLNLLDNISHSSFCFIWRAELRVALQASFCKWNVNPIYILKCNKIETLIPTRNISGSCLGWGDFQNAAEAPKGTAQRTTEVHSPAIEEDWDGVNSRALLLLSTGCKFGSELNYSSQWKRDQSYPLSPVVVRLSLRVWSNTRLLLRQLSVSI